MIEERLSEDVGHAMFEQFVGVAQQHDVQQPFVLMLSGGRSVLPFFEQIRTHHARIADAFWSCVEVFFVDERIVAVDTGEHNGKQFIDAVGEDVVRKIGAVHLFSPDMGVEEYAQAFAVATRDLMKADVIIAGIGEDGHIASLFPLHTALHINDVLFTHITDAPKPPAQRMTATRLVFECAKQTWLVVLGQKKFDVYAHCVANNSDAFECPCALGLVADDVVVFTDVHE